MATEVILAPLRRSSWLGIFWPAYNRGSLWLLNIPEAMHHLRPEQKRACHQPEYEWDWDGDRLCARIRAEAPDPQAALELVFRADEFGVAVDLRVTNLQDAPYLDGALLGVCLRNNAAWQFGDPDGGRTFVRAGGRWVSLLDLFGDQAIHQARHMPLGQARSVCDEGIIARRNEQSQFGCAIAWNRTAQLCSNLHPRISCIHRDPLAGALPPGGSVRLRGRVWFGRWDLDELHTLYRQEFPHE